MSAVGALDESEQKTALPACEVKKCAAWKTTLAAFTNVDGTSVAGT